MPRVYKPDPRSRRYKRYPKELIDQAIREYKESNKSLSVVAAKFEIAKSVLYRHSIKKMKKQGGQTVLSKETELKFIKYINICAEWGYPLELYDLRVLVKNYLDRLGIKEKRFKDNMPGLDFARSFLKRYSDKITQRVSQNIKRNRAALSADIIKEYFERLKIAINDVPIDNIVNYDETNLTDDPGCKKIIIKRGTKYPERLMNHSKTCVSIMMACTASGEILPPYVVYKSQNLLDSWTKSGPKGARYNRSQSGWFDSNVFEDWVTTMILPYFENKPGKKCLIGDNVSTHLSIDLIKKCKEKDIHFIFLPAHSIHLTQPLVFALFRPMKIAWRNIILQWKKTDDRNQSIIPKDCFPKLLCKLMETLKENGAKNIISGFRKTGIHPFDSSEVLKRISDRHTVSNFIDPSKEAETVDSKVLNFLKEMRYKAINIVEPKKKKLKIQAEKSVLCSSDEDNIESDLEHSPCSVLRENNENQKYMTGKVTKGKGKGKKPKIKSNPSVLEDHGDQEKAYLSDEVIPSCSLNISTTPVIFEDDLCGIGHIVETIVRDVKNENPKKKILEKVEIIPNVQVTNGELKKIISNKKEYELEDDADIIICDVCSKNFTSETDLNNHMMVEHIELYCTENLILDCKSTDSQNRESEDNEDIVFCDQCPESFACETDLANHMMVEHIELYHTEESSLAGRSTVSQVCLDVGTTNPSIVNKQLVTEACVKTIAPEDVEYILIKSDDGPIPNHRIKRLRAATARCRPKKNENSITEKYIPDPFECFLFSNNTEDGICSQTFMSCCEYSKRTQEHSKGRKWVRCHVCEKPIAIYDTETAMKPYACQNSLEQHHRWHKGERPFRCEHCPKTFSQKAGLVQHTRRHTQEKPYICVICSKGFAQGIHLKLHMRTHTLVEPYVCGFCDKRFKQSAKLEKHLKSQHRPSKLKNKDDINYNEVIEDLDSKELEEMEDEAILSDACKIEYMEYLDEDETDIVSNQSWEIELTPLDDDVEEVIHSYTSIHKGKSKVPSNM